MKKSDVTIKEGSQCSIEIGSRVIIKDGSYSMSVTKDGVRHTSLGLSDHVFEVVDINKPFPTEEGILDVLRPINNCMIRSTEDNSIHFCSNLNIRNIENLVEY